MTKHVALKDNIYEELDNLKPDKERSFSFVIKQLIDENKAQKEEIQRKNRIIKKLTSGDKIDDDEILTEEYLKKRRELESESVDI